MRADREALIERTRAVLVERCVLLGDVRQIVGVVLLGFERPAAQEVQILIEHRGIACRFNVVGGDVSKPGAIIGDLGAHALPRRGQPPVLHVALDELPRGRAQHLFAREVRMRQHERHGILQLVAEAIGAACLIKSGTRPHAAGERLIQEPAIERDVHLALGRLHLHCRERFVPEGDDGAQPLLKIGRAVTTHELAGLRGAFGLAQKEHHLTRRLRIDPHGALKRRAGIEARAHVLGERLPATQTGRTLERTVAADELAPVARPARLLTA